MALACRIDLMEILFGTKGKGYTALIVFKHNFYQDAFLEFKLHFRLLCNSNLMSVVIKGRSAQI